MKIVSIDNLGNIKSLIGSNIKSIILMSILNKHVITKFYKLRRRDVVKDIFQLTYDKSTIKTLQYENDFNIR